MIRCFKIDKENKNIIANVEVEKNSIDYVEFVPLNEFPYPLNINKPIWDSKNKRWKESAKKADIETANKYNLIVLREEKINQAKQICKQQCLELADEYKQMNLIREGDTENPIFIKIDTIRKLSNKLEEKILKIKTIKEMKELNIPLEFFSPDDIGILGGVTNGTT